MLRRQLPAQQGLDHAREHPHGQPCSRTPPQPWQTVHMSSEEQNASSAAEETKRKFREALERKQKAASRGKGESHLDGQGAANRSQGPASHQREFRRKSG